MRRRPSSSRCSSEAANRWLHVDAELPLEVFAVDVPELHLKNELANHPLFVGGRERAVDREHALVDTVDIRVPIVLVLIVGAVDVREGSHAETDHVGAGPQAGRDRETGCVAGSFTAVYALAMV